MSRYDQGLQKYLGFAFAAGEMGRLIICEGLQGCDDFELNFPFNTKFEPSRGNYRTIFDMERRQAIIYIPFCNIYQPLYKQTQFAFVEYDEEGAITKKIAQHLQLKYFDTDEVEAVHVKTEFTAVFPNGKRYFMILISPQTPFSFKQLTFEMTAE